MHHYILNSPSGDAAEPLRAGMWAVDEGEPHRAALAAGDRVLVYLGAPTRKFVGRAELASAVDDRGRVLLAQVEEWAPPVPMNVVLARLDSATAKADFDVGVVRNTEHEYETVLEVAAGR